MTCMVFEQRLDTAPVCVPHTGRQVIPQIDVKIVKKSHLWMENRYLNPASVEFAEDLPVPARQTGARRQGRRRTTIKSLPRRFGKIGAPKAVNYFQKSQPL